MKNNRIQPVILCGVSGTRLWPLSRAGFHKHFLSPTVNESLFQQTARRLMSLGSADNKVDESLIVTGEEHRFLAAEQLREVGIEFGGGLVGACWPRHCSKTVVGRNRETSQRPNPGACRQARNDAKFIPPGKAEFIAKPCESVE